MTEREKKKRKRMTGEVPIRIRGKKINKSGDDTLRHLAKDSLKPLLDQIHHFGAESVSDIVSGKDEQILYARYNDEDNLDKLYMAMTKGTLTLKNAADQDKLEIFIKRSDYRTCRCQIELEKKGLEVEYKGGERGVGLSADNGGDDESFDKKGKDRNPVFELEEGRGKARHVVFKARTKFDSVQTQTLGKMIGEPNLIPQPKNEIDILTESYENILQILREEPMWLSRCGVGEVRMKYHEIVGGQYEESIYSLPVPDEVKKITIKKDLDVELSEDRVGFGERESHISASQASSSRAAPMPLEQEETKEQAPAMSIAEHEGDIKERPNVPIEFPVVARPDVPSERIGIETVEEPDLLSERPVIEAEDLPGEAIQRSMIKTLETTDVPLERAVGQTPEIPDVSSERTVLEIPGVFFEGTMDKTAGGPAIPFERTVVEPPERPDAPIERTGIETAEEPDLLSGRPVVEAEDLPGEPIERSMIKTPQTTDVPLERTVVQTQEIPDVPGERTVAEIPGVPFERTLDETAGLPVVPFERTLVEPPERPDEAIERTPEETEEVGHAEQDDRRLMLHMATGSEDEAHRGDADLQERAIKVINLPAIRAETVEGMYGEEEKASEATGWSSPSPEFAAEQRERLRRSVSDIFLDSQRRRFMTIADLRRRPWIYPPGFLHTRHGSEVLIDRDEREIQITTENHQGLPNTITFDEFPEEFQPWDVATTLDDTVLFITDRGNQQVIVSDDNGEVITTFGHDLDMDPRGIARLGEDRVVVTDTRNNCVRLFTVDGEIVATSRPGLFNYPHSVAVNSRNQVIVTDNGNLRVLVLDSHLRPLYAFGSEGSDDGELSFPQGVAVDRLDNIYVCDFGNFRIAHYDPDGNFEENDYLPVQPSAIAIEHDEDQPVARVYVTDLLNYCIKVFLHFLSQFDDAMGFLILQELFKDLQ